jgi:hypothetical protein
VRGLHRENLALEKLEAGRRAVECVPFRHEGQPTSRRCHACVTR